MSRLYFPLIFPGLLIATWAERAKTAGYPERFAQEALGHNSKAVHRAYAKRALMKLTSRVEYELKNAEMAKAENIFTGSPDRTESANRTCP